MYARSTSITGDPTAIDDGIAFIRDEVMPVMTAMDGCVGLSAVVDRETGRCIATSSWETQEAMAAGRDALASYRARGGELLGGNPVVEEWEVAVMHRDHPSVVGACCRITWARPRDLDATVEMWKTRLLGQLEEMEGFCSASMLIDRENGVTCGTVTFDSRAALEGSREAAAALRATVGRDYDIEFLDVAEFDLALAHLRVPELV